MRRGPPVTCALLLASSCAVDGFEPWDAIPRKMTRGDLGIVFETVDEAAKAGCAYIWRYEPRAVDIEFCGVIYRDHEGIKAGLPETSNKTNRCRRPLEPAGTEAEAGYHNHRVTGKFSRRDREHGASDPAYGTALTHYLCAPGGLVWKMTPEGMVIVK